MTIVVGIDSSEPSVEALRFAIDECRLRGAKLQAVHAWQLPFVPTSQDPFLAGGLIDIPLIDPADLRGVAEQQLAETVASVDGHGVEVEQIVVEGHPAEALVEASAEAEMLVVGSRGHGGFAELLLGSVSHACAQHARCPVAIVRTERPFVASDGGPHGGRGAEE